MNRYHKAVYIPEKEKACLQAYSDVLNTLKWRYSKHTLDTLKYKAIRYEDILLFIKNTILRGEYIFEYYIDNTDIIIKACYRIPYIKGTDIIAVIGNDKTLITIYTNTSNDNHITLNKNLYIKKEV